MGSTVTACSCDGETREKLKKAEKKNQELKQQLIDARKSKNVEYQNQKIAQLNHEKTEALQRLQSEKTKYTKEKKSNQQLKRKVHELSLEIESLRDELNPSAVEPQYEIEITPPNHKNKNKNKTSSEPQLEHSLSIETTQLFGMKTAKQKNKFQQFADIQMDDLTKAQTSAIEEDIVMLRNCIARQSLSEKALKSKLANFLTERNETERLRLSASYNHRYHASDEETILEDISQIIRKGFVLDLIESLFKTRVQFDATCIRDIVLHRKTKAGAIELSDILCCRGINKLKEICYQYKQLYGAEMKDDLAQMVSGRTYQTMIQHLFTFTRNANKTTDKNKIAAKIQGDMEYLMDKNVKWNKSHHKQKVALMLIGNNDGYVRDLNELYFKESTRNLVDFIDDRFGEKNLSAVWMKVRIEYCSDRWDFYARKIQIAGEDGWDAWNKTKGQEINRIFISMFGNELSNIRNKFNELNYGNSRTMIEWIKETCPRERHGAFLIKMLKNCSHQTR